MLTISPVRFRQLAPSQLELWTRWQEAAPSLRSPCFRPEFTRLVDAVRADVEVAVFEQRGETVGFLPFERRPGNRAVPVAGALSDFHGVIVGPGTVWTAPQFLDGCGLVSFAFDHLLADQTAFEEHHWNRVESPALDLSEGFEAYSRHLREASASQLKRIQRRTRKLEREIGPLRCVFHETDDAIFERLVDWKRQQYRDTGVPDRFAVDWTVALLRRVLDEKGPGFRGVLGTLYAGDTLASIDLGIASHGVLQSWFPAYNRDLASYSPGLIHLLETARHGEANGIHRIELGRGEEPYKRFFGNAGIEVAEGVVDTRPVVGWCRRTMFNTATWIRKSPLRDAFRKPARLLRRLGPQAFQL